MRDRKLLIVSTTVLFSILTSKTSGIDDKKINMHLAIQCPSRQNECRNITSITDRVVSLLDDGLEVMCDTKTDGGGWIIFQRRINGNVNFNRGWEEYKYGFGDYDVGEFYLGNEHIFRLTSQDRYELRLEIKYKNNFYFAQYSQFRLFDERNKYMLKIHGYSGNATDEMDYSANMKFSTFDNDNDGESGNCAKHWGSAWWFKSCFYVNLNGNWGSKQYARGVNWQKLTSYEDSATFTEMKMRKVI